MSSTEQQGRRGFLKKAATAAAAVVAPGVVLHALPATAAPRTEAVNAKVRWGMLIDANKCADGCNDCVTACDKENGLDLVDMPEGADEAHWERQRPRWIRQVKLKDNLSGKITNLP
ncbi:twin-arginine translocation signal domain-containing protein, partial [Thiolapillus sp.]